MKIKFPILFISLAFLLSCHMASGQKVSESSGEYKMDRTILPIKAPVIPLYTELDAREATKPERFEVKAPVWVQQG